MCNNHSNKRNDLQVREEHTERLKQGFIKVVQKEKEFERQLQNQQREEQLMQQKLAEQQRQQQQQIMEVRLNYNSVFVAEQLLLYENCQVCP